MCRADGFYSLDNYKALRLCDIVISTSYFAGYLSMLMANFIDESVGACSTGMKTAGHVDTFIGCMRSDASVDLHP